MCIYTLAEVDLIADVNSEVSASGRRHLFAGPCARDPRRARLRHVDGLFEGQGRIPAGRTVALVVAGRGGVPSDARR